jgi:hypothetical protein
LFYPGLYENAWSLPRTNLVSELEATLDSCGQIPPQLFTEPHPAPREQERQLWLSEPKSLAFAPVTVLGVFGNCIVGHSNDGNVYTITLSFERKNEPNISSRTWNKRLPATRGVSLVSLTKIAAILRKGEIAMIEPAGFARVEFGAAKIVSGHQECIFVGRSDTGMTLCRNLEIQKTFPSFRDEIVCAAVSATYDLVVVGAHSSALFLISPSHQTITRVISLADRDPYMVEITQGWGFIVVYEKARQADTKYIELFTVNGEFIRRVEFAFAIRCWSVSTSIYGFDYLVVAAKDGRIYVAEAFYLNLEGVKRVSEDVQSIFYIESLRVIVVSQKDRPILLIPFRAAEGGRPSCSMAH